MRVIINHVRVYFIPPPALSGSGKRVQSEIRFISAELHQLPRNIQLAIFIMTRSHDRVNSVALHCVVNQHIEPSSSDLHYFHLSYSLSSIDPIDYNRDNRYYLGSQQME